MRRLRHRHGQLIDRWLDDRTAKLVERKLVGRKLVDRKLLDRRLVDRRLVDRRLVDRKLLDRKLVDRVEQDRATALGDLARTLVDRTISAARRAYLTMP